MGGFFYLFIYISFACAIIPQPSTLFLLLGFAVISSLGLTQTWLFPCIPPLFSYSTVSCVFSSVLFYLIITFAKIPLVNFPLFPFRFFLLPFHSFTLPWHHFINNIFYHIFSTFPFPVSSPLFTSFFSLLIVQLFFFVSFS